MMAAIVGATILSSCKKFFDLAPESSATTGNAYNTVADMDAALIGVYQTLYTDYFIWENYVMSDVRSDNAYAGGDDSEIYQSKLKFNITLVFMILGWPLIVFIYILAFLLKHLYLDSQDLPK